MAKGARTTGHGGAVTLTNAKIGYQAPRRSPDTRIADLRPPETTLEHNQQTNKPIYSAAAGNWMIQVNIGLGLATFQIL